MQPNKSDPKRLLYNNLYHHCTTFLFWLWCNYLSNENWISLLDFIFKFVLWCLRPKYQLIIDDSSSFLFSFFLKLCGWWEFKNSVCSFKLQAIVYIYIYSNNVAYEIWQLKMSMPLILARCSSFKKSLDKILTPMIKRKGTELP